MELLNKYQSVIKKLVLIIVIFATIYISITYLFPFFAPFFIAIIVSYINEPVIKLLRKMKVSRKIAAVISLLVTISALAFAIVAGIFKIYNELTALQSNLNTYSSDISDKINALIKKATTFYNALPVEVTDTITKNLASLSTRITALITAVIQYTIDTVSSIPKLTIFVIVTILVTLVLLLYYRSIGAVAALTLALFAGTFWNFF